MKTRTTSWSRSYWLLISVQFCSTRLTPGRVANLCAVSLFFERVSARIRCCDKALLFFSSPRRCSTTPVPVLPVAPTTRIVGAILLVLLGVGLYDRCSVKLCDLRISVACNNRSFIYGQTIVVEHTTPSNILLYHWQQRSSLRRAKGLVRCGLQ